MESNIKIEVKGENSNELIIREGQAPPVKPKNPLRLSGTVDSVIDFWKKRNHLFEKEKCHIIFSMITGVVILSINENDAWENITVRGEMCENTEFEKLGINNESSVDLKTLLKKIRFNSHLFKDQAEYHKIIDSLQNFNAEINANIKQLNDRQGNKNNTFEQKVKTNQPLSFILKAPLHYGMPESHFKVDVLFDVRGSVTEFWLESVEMVNMQVQEKMNVIKNAVNEFKDSIVVLETNYLCK